MSAAVKLQASTVAHARARQRATHARRHADSGPTSQRAHAAEGVARGARGYTAQSVPGTPSKNQHTFTHITTQHVVLPCQPPGAAAALLRAPAVAVAPPGLTPGPRRPHPPAPPPPGPRRCSRPPARLARCCPPQRWPRPSSRWRSSRSRQSWRCDRRG